jgi:hypothetical protein
MRSLLIIIIGLLVFTGCSRVSHNGAAPQQNQSPNGILHTQQTIPENNTYLQSQQIVTHLEQLASSIPNVQHAHCVILGKTATQNESNKSRYK